MPSLFTEKNVQLVLRTLLRLGAPQSQVEDLAQEVFVVVHRRAAEFDSSRRIEPWLYGIARNVMREARRKAGTKHESVAPGGDAAEHQVSQGYVDAPAHDDVHLLRQAISGLPEPLLDVLMLCDLMGMTLQETARELGIPVNTAKDRLRRGRRQLRTAVQKLEGEVRCV